MKQQGFFLWRTKHRHIDLTAKQLSELLTLDQYGKKYGYSRSGVRYLMKTCRVDAYKMQSRWWVADRDPLP